VDMEWRRLGGYTRVQADSGLAHGRPGMDISETGMTEDQVKHMVNRFLGWKLPPNFNPDGGISYTRPNYAPEVDATPTGTNLFDAMQADAMVRYMIDGLPSSEN